LTLFKCCKGKNKQNTIALSRNINSNNNNNMCVDLSRSPYNSTTFSNICFVLFDYDYSSNSFDCWLGGYLIAGWAAGIARLMMMNIATKFSILLRLVVVMKALCSSLITY